MSEYVCRYAPDVRCDADESKLDVDVGVGSGRLNFWRLVMIASNSTSTVVK